MRWRKEDGQSTVEFALVLPILLLLIFGMMDFGWLFYNKVMVNNASREGARYAVINCGTIGYGDAHETTIAYVESLLPGAVVTVEPTPISGDQITVTVNKEIRVLTGITSVFLGNTIDLQATCTMRIE